MLLNEHTVNINTLLYNENITQMFLNCFFDDIRDDEVIMLILFARKKYCSDVVSDEYIYYRDIVIPDIKNNIKFPEIILRKIIRTSFISDNYIDRKTEKKIPFNAFVYYIDLNPKSMMKAFCVFDKEGLDLLYRITRNPDEIKQVTKLKSKFMSAIHRSNSRKKYFIIDIDTKNRDVLDQCIDAVNENYVWISNTRGGYHIILEKNKENGKLVYENIVAVNKRLSEKSPFKDVEIKNEAMTPIPGTIQGGFMVDGWAKK